MVEVETFQCIQSHVAIASYGGSAWTISMYIAGVNTNTTGSHIVTGLIT